MTSKTASNKAPRAGRREWLGLAIIALPCLLYSMDFTVLHLAVPHLSAALRPTSAQLLWIVDIYGFLLAGALVTMGVLGDRIGRRKLLLIGAGFFGLASVFAAFSRNAEMLIASRALLGLAASTLAPSTLSLIRNMFFDPKQRSVAIGVWIASFSAGAAIGPLIGGLLLDHFWWGSVFLIAVPPIILLLALAPKLLPEYRTEDAGRIDLISAGMSLVAILSVIYGIKQVAEGHVGLIAAGSVLLGLLVAGLFIRRQQTLKQPFVDLGLFRRRIFTTVLIVNTIDFFIGFGAFFFITQYLQLELGMGPLQAGLWTLPGATIQVVGSLMTPFFMRRIRPAHIVAASMLLSAVGFGLLTLLKGSNDLWLLIAGSTIFSFALIHVTTVSTDLILSNVPPKRAGMASGLSETTSELGGALGIALLGSVAAFVYRGDLSSTVPAGVPSHTLGMARDTLGAALSITNQVPDSLRSGFVRSAKMAFAHSTDVAFGLCALLSLAMAIISYWALRSLKPHPPEPEA